MISRVWDVCAVALICFLFVTTINAEELKVELKAENYEIITTIEGFHEIRMENFGNLLTPGKPMLPGKTFLIVVPLGAEVNSINVKGVGCNEIPGKFRIAPAPVVFPMDHRKNLVDEATETYLSNKAIHYSNNQFYPENTAWHSGQGALGKYNFIKVTFAPFTYFPNSQKLVHSPSVEITINYSFSQNSNTKMGEHNLNRKAQIPDKKAANILFNYNEAKNWYAPQAQLNKVTSTYNYVILTTEKLENAMSTFVNWKVSVGFTVKVITTNWIDGLYPGSDLPEKIRNFLIDKYGEWGIEYVLLVGDINDIPMRECHPRPNSPQGATPTDYYYADLTGNWNSDGDSYFGEYDQDDVDWVPEVLVGRIPWSDYSTVAQICQKLAEFEGNKGAWKNDALLLGAMSNFKKEGDSQFSRTDGAALMEVNKSLVSNNGGNSTTLYEKTGINPNENECSASLTNENVMNIWSTGQFGLVSWWAHGSSSEAYRKLWDSDDGDNIPETSDPNEISWETMISSDDCNLLNDEFASIIFACSCFNGDPDSDNLGKELIKNGSAGIVASSRLSWYSIGWSHKDHGGNASIDYYFFENLINKNNRVGEALYNSKVHYSNHFLYSSWGWVGWQNMFDFNLYGDPSMCHTGLTPSKTNLNISGNIYYNNSTMPINNAELSLSWISTNIQTTNESGYYQFQFLPPGENYIITPLENPNVPKNCISSYDAALAAQIVTGLLTDVTDEQKLAADVDKNGFVQIFDAALIAQYAIGLSDDPYSCVGDWVFNPAQRTYQPLSVEHSDQNFSALILGDVDCNWGANMLSSKANNLLKTYTGLKDETVFPCSNFVIPFSVEEQSEIISFDISLKINPDIMKFSGIIKADDVKDFEIFSNCTDDGIIKIAGFSLNPKELSGNYITLNFDIVGNPEGNGKIELMNYTVNNEPGFFASANIKIENQAFLSLPLKFNLSQNYPNPFNPSTTIRYEIPKATQVTITVFNLLGERINTLVDEEKQAGRYSVLWNGRNEIGGKVPSGLYFYRLESDRFSRTFKMLMTK